MPCAGHLSTLRHRFCQLAFAGALLVTVASVQWLVEVGPVALAASGTLHVDRGSPNCNDQGSGTLTQPYCTIGAAAAAATAGVTVEVSIGTYPESVSVGHSGLLGAPITFAAAAGASVTISGQAHGFVVSSRSWITISGFNITGTSSDGILLSNSSHITVDGVHVSYAGQPVSGLTELGINLEGTTDSLIENTIVDHNTWMGIGLHSGSTRVEVRHNLVFNNAAQWERAAAGIDVESTFDTIDYNVVHDNEDSGIQFFTGGDSGTAFGNVSYNNGDHGIDNLNVTGGALTGNTVYHNCTSGINVEGTSSNYTVENNIAVDNAVYPAYNGLSCPSGRKGNIGVWDSAPATTTADYNLLNLTTSGELYRWAGTAYSTIAALYAATGQEAHGINADPNWMGQAGGNFHLEPGSPAIDSANSSAPSEPATDLEGNSRVDDPATPNTGAGLRAYDDRGAYEFQATVSDTEPPSMPNGFSATSISPPHVNLSWNSSTDNVGVTGYTVYRDGAAFTTVSGATLAYTDAAVTDATNYTYAVDAFDAAGNHSPQSAPVTVTTPDITPPSVPTGVSAIALAKALVNVSWSASTDNMGVTGYTVYRDGVGLAAVSHSTLSYADTTVAPSTTYSYTIDAFDAAGNHSVQSAPTTVTTPANITYTAVTPTRLFDTRNSKATLGAGGSVNLTMGGVDGVPTNATAVVINVTAVNESTAGALIVYPTGATRPLASNLNWVAHQTVPNLVTVGLGSGGQVTIFNLAGSTDVVVDLEGYYAPASGTSAGEFVPVLPSRITDTRPGSGAPNSGMTLGPLANLDVQVTGAGGIPAGGVSAVVMNVTATGTTSAGFFTVFPTGTGLPLASNLNWTPRETVPNRVIVAVGTGGKVTFHNGPGRADLVVDVSGYFTDSTGTGSSFNALIPTRIVDTRDGTGGFTTPLGPGATMVVSVAGKGGVPSMASVLPPTAVVLNVTVQGATAPSYLTVWPDGTSLPLASDLNFTTRQTVPNLVVVKLSATGQIEIRNAFGSTNVIVDVDGWYG